MVSVQKVVTKNPKVKNIHKTTKAQKTKKKNPTKTKFASLKENLKEEVAHRNLVEKKKTEENLKVNYVMPSKSVTDDLVTSSLKALHQLGTHYKKKNIILEDETPIFAEIKCIKIQNSKGNIKFILPHSTVASTGEVCLITPDLKKGKKIDHEPTIDFWEETLRNAGVTVVKTVLPMRQLRVEYDQFELKRRLMTQHDFIMVDSRVLSHVSHILGKMFFKKHNMLIPVRINQKRDLKKDIDIGLRTAMLRLNEGPTSVILVGHTGMSQLQLKENILSLVKQLHERYPGGEANIRSISLKFPLSLSLPLYLTLRPSNVIKAPKLKHKKPKHFAVLEDELSTIPDSIVQVAADGTVHLKKQKKTKAVMDALEQDEVEDEEEINEEQYDEDVEDD